MHGEGLAELGATAPREFTTTHWSVVVAAADPQCPRATEALEQLCRTYWYPLYAFVRREGYSPEDAQDLTQECFARLLARPLFASAEPARGRFRNFLLGCLKHSLSEQRRHAGRLKRGGGQTVISWDNQTAEEQYQSEPADLETPETVYDRNWALTLLEKALARLDAEQAAVHKAEVFAQLKDYLWGERSGTGYAEAALRLGTTEGALKVTVHRLRRRYRELLREEVAHTLSTGEDIDEELRHLVAVIRG